jgi:hypothetical protein
MDDVHDPEKRANSNFAEDASRPSQGFTGKVLKYLSAGPVEFRGVLPVPLEERTSNRYSNYVRNVKHSPFLP